MSRNESLIMVQASPATVVAALDTLLATEGLARTTMHTITVDWLPLITDPAGPLAVVLSAPVDEWVGCWTSLDLDSEWVLAESLALALDLPVGCVVASGAQALYGYRLWHEGDLRAESLPGVDSPLDETALLAELTEHGLPPALLDERTDNFAAEHLVLGYTRAITGAASSNGAASDGAAASNGATDGAVEGV